MELHDAIIKQDEELRKQVNFPDLSFVGSGSPCSCALLALRSASMHGDSDAWPSGTSDALAFQSCLYIFLRCSKSSSLLSKHEASVHAAFPACLATHTCFPVCA